MDKLDAASPEIVFVVHPMFFDDAPPLEVRERDDAAANFPKPISGEIASRREISRQPAPAPPPDSPSATVAPTRDPPAEIQPAPVSAMPNPEKSEPNEFAIASYFNSPVEGSANGWSGHGGFDGIGSIATGSEETLNGGGKGLSGPVGGGGEERDIGASGGPSLVKLKPPVYPKSARRMGKEGKVLLSLLIDKSGRLVDVRVIEKAGYGFDEAAMEAVRLSSFKPAVENGTPIACRARMAIRFELKDAM